MKTTHFSLHISHQAFNVALAYWGGGYIVVCQGSGVSIKNRHANADKRTPQDPLAL